MKIHNLNFIEKYLFFPNERNIISLQLRKSTEVSRKNKINENIVKESKKNTKNEYIYWKKNDRVNKIKYRGDVLGTSSTPVWAV